MTHDERISEQSDDLQPTLRQIREAIRTAAPQAKLALITLADSFLQYS